MRILLIVAAVFTNLLCFSQVENWRIDPAHSAAQFSVRHMGISTVRGAFTNLAGTVAYSPSSVEDLWSSCTRACAQNNIEALS